MAGFTSAVVAVVGILSLAHPASAQSRGQGFAYTGPIAFTGSNPPALVSFGGGLDALTKNGAGASFEAGLIGLSDLWVAQISANAMYEKHFDHAAVRPFISGGLSLFGAGQAINVGGGVNLWGRGRTALRVDVRDYVFPAAGGGQAIAFRVGVTFR
jgi:hypothetical protein